MNATTSKLTTLAAIAILAMSGRPATAGIISLDESASSISLGETVSIDLTVAGLGEFVAPTLGAFTAEVLFDPLVLALDSITFGDFLGAPDPDHGAGVGSPFETDIFVTQTPGSISMDELSFLFDFELDPLQPGSFVLATMTFTGAGAGVSSVDIGSPLFSDAFGFPISLTGINGATISVASAVPEPSSVVLFGLGSLFLLRIARNRHAALSRHVPNQDGSGSIRSFAGQVSGRA